MSGRERILSALKRKPIDRIPFVPLIEPYTLMDMPEEISSKAVGRGFDPMRMVAACRALGCDPMIRHVPATTPLGQHTAHLAMLGSFADPVEARSTFDQGTLTETLTTPAGTVFGQWKFTDKVGLIPHAIKHAVTNYEELKIFHSAVEHLTAEHVKPDHGIFMEVERAIGDDGIATASVSNSPLMYLIEVAWGLENTYYMLQDYPAEVEDILERLHGSLKRYVEVLAETKAEVVIQYENTSTTLLSPKVFEKYCLPCLNEYADILTSAGKIFLIHMCGRLYGLRDWIARGRFTGVCDIPPHPTGDFPLDVAAASLPGKVVVGGIDPTTFISEDSAFVEAEVSGLIERIKPYPGVLLGSADVTPRGARVENFVIIRRLVETVGRYA